MTARRALVAGGVIVAVAAIAFAAVRTTGGESDVLGSKVTRCRTVDGTSSVSSGARRLTADNAPLTVTVSGGRIAAVLAPAFKAQPGPTSSERIASFTISRPRTSAGRLTADIVLRNLTDCAAKVSLAEAVARRDGASARSTIRFGAADRAVVSPGERVGGTFSIPLQGDGTYEITATTVTEIGLVR